MDEESIRAIFSGVGPVRIRRMFGGRGIYNGDRMFGLEMGGELYLKADAETEPLFRSAGFSRFTFARLGRIVETSYWRMPSPLLEDDAEAAHWFRRADEAARRAGTSAKGRRADRGRPSRMTHAREPET